jgi:hypothetical protein
MKDKKDPAAVALGEKRWEGVSKKKRSEITRAAVNERWKKASQADRQALGAKTCRGPEEEGRRQKENGRGLRPQPLSVLNCRSSPAPVDRTEFCCITRQ